jgi:hypothetical protein
LIVLYLAAIGIFHFEHDAQPEKFTSVFDSLWWAVSTLTTVGYGDIYPITPGGRLFTFVVLVLGLGVIAVHADKHRRARVRAEKWPTAKLQPRKSRSATGPTSCCGTLTRRVAPLQALRTAASAICRVSQTRAIAATASPASAASQKPSAPIGGPKGVTLNPSQNPPPRPSPQSATP